MRKWLLILILISTQLHAMKPSFELVPLGVYGGLWDGELSSYIVRAVGESRYLALDAGTVFNGLQKAYAQGAFSGINVKHLLQDGISHYLISHAHLDHVMGLLMLQPALRQQQVVIGSNKTMAALEKNVFNWQVWANFGDKGKRPHLNYQQFKRVKNNQWHALKGLHGMSVMSMPLNHGQGYPSSAFLVKHDSEYLLYLGDTGADSVEKDDKMHQVWQAVAPLIKQGRLHAMLLECSFDNSTKKSQLSGHLTPTLFINALADLAKLSGKQALSQVPIFVTHIKPKLNFAPRKQALKILSEIKLQSSMRQLQLKLLLPKQGETYQL